ncbi:hypothetical protein CMT89_17745 [Elizabethkingia anophelis]|nr:hypothetical protein [Elizabethkingia anophelis]MDV4057253.1 hypothetical protein [Elizabethkingia anophelis]
MEEKNELTTAEKTYLLKMYRVLATDSKRISTSQMAKLLEVKAPSATDMLKRLAARGLVSYSKYYDCEMTEEGIRIASVISRQLTLTRKFLIQKLDMNEEDSQRIAEKIITLNEPVLFKKIKRALILYKR